MWRSWTIGFLGIWTVLSALILNPGSTQKVLLVFTGLIISVISFSKVLSEHRGEQLRSVEAIHGEQALADNNLENE